MRRKNLKSVENECDNVCETITDDIPMSTTTSGAWWDDSFVIRVPKVIARIKICGGGLTFTITDNMVFEMPTEEQRENLKKTFGIEVELVNE